MQICRHTSLEICMPGHRGSNPSRWLLEQSGFIFRISRARGKTNQTLIRRREKSLHEGRYYVLYLPGFRDLHSRVRLLLKGLFFLPNAARFHCMSISRLLFLFCPGEWFWEVENWPCLNVSFARSFWELLNRLRSCI